jgi:crossover junction endodeoxyribonuclease RusA
MTETVWHLEVPFAEDGLPPLTANHRLHWAVRNRRTQEIKDAVGWRARARIPRGLEHIAVRLVYQPQDRRRRDPSNLMPTQKAALDALVVVGVVRDDTPEFVTEEIPAVLSPDGGDRGLWLVVEHTPLRSPEARQWIEEDSRHERTQDAAGGDQDV